MIQCATKSRCYQHKKGVEDLLWEYVKATIKQFLNAVTGVDVSVS